MPLYTYEASDSGGRKHKATMEAQDGQAVKSALRAKGLLPLSINEAEQGKASALKRITSKDLLTFTQELGSLLDSGLPVDRAIYLLSQYTGKPHFREVIREVYKDLQRGQSLSQAMSRHKAFPPIYLNMIRAGEAGGILDKVVSRLAVFLETANAFREEVISALIYPILLTLVGGLAVVVLMIYVVPKFSEIFADMGQALPAPTMLLLGLSNYFISYWWMAALIIFAIVLVLRTYAQTAEGRLYIDGLKTKVPMIKGIHMQIVIARFARTLGTLLQSGVPILEAIRISRGVAGNESVSERLKAVEEGVGKGRGVAAPLRECGVFPQIVGQIVSTGEEAGRLEDTFLFIAERFEADSRRLIKRTLSLLEPVMILVMGLVVGFIVLSMLYAVFSINEIPI